mgnify:CR=1 FL=1
MRRRALGRRPHRRRRPISGGPPAASSRSARRCEPKLSDGQLRRRPSAPSSLNQNQRGQVHRAGAGWRSARSTARPTCCSTRGSRRGCAGRRMRRRVNNRGAGQRRGEAEGGGQSGAGPPRRAQVTRGDARTERVGRIAEIRVSTCVINWGLTLLIESLSVLLVIRKLQCRLGSVRPSDARPSSRPARGCAAANPTCPIFRMKPWSPSSATARSSPWGIFRRVYAALPPAEPADGTAQPRTVAASVGIAAQADQDGRKTAKLDQESPYKGIPGRTAG